MLPPQPNEAFEWVQGPAGPALVCRPLERVAPNLFTTRAWPLGSAVAGAEDRCWSDVARALGVGTDRLIRVRQVHGANLVVCRAGDVIATHEAGGRPAADIIVSNNPAIAIAVQTADCVPLLIADPRTGSVAAAHIGWRGTVASVVQVAIDALTREFASRPSDLVAALGPSIGACCYEVGADVRERFEAAGFSGAQLGRWLVSRPQPSPRNPSMAILPRHSRPGHWFFDGWTATRDQLTAAGVPAWRLHAAELCTASHVDAFCSYRRDGPPAGRIAGAIRAPSHRQSQGSRVKERGALRLAT